MPSPLSAAAPNDPATVWIVEDRQDFREAVHNLLSGQSGISCSHALASCEELFAALNETFAPEVILMDIGLPGMSGIEGVKRLKTIAPSTQVIMLTIHEDNDRIFEAICAGASGYLLKTTPAAKIIESIEEVRRGGAAMTPQVARRILNIFTQLRAPRWDYQLTEREREILNLLVEGKTKQQIADALFLSFHTIDTHLRNTYTKLHVNSRSDAVAKAVKERLV